MTMEVNVIGIVGSKKVQEPNEIYARNSEAFMNIIPPFMSFGQQIKTKISINRNKKFYSE